MHSNWLISSQAPSFSTLQEAREALAAGNITQAKIACEQALAEAPHHCDAQHAAAIYLFHKQAWQEAIIPLSHAVNLGMQYHHFYHYEASMLHLKRGRLLAHTESNTSAHADYKAALHMDHLNQPAQAWLGTGTEQGMYDSAPYFIAEIHHAIRLKDIPSPAAAEQLASHLANKNYPALLEVLATHPPHADSLHDMGCCHYLLGDTAKALTFWQETIHLDQTHSYSHHRLADIALATQDNNAALKHLDSALALLAQRHDYYHAQASLHHEHRAYAFTKLQRLDEAVRDYSKALDLNRKNINALLGRAETYMQKNNWRDAAQDYQTALLANPSSPIAQDGLTKAEQMAWAS